MELTQLTEFVGNHPMLFGMLGLILGLLTWTFIAGSKGSVDTTGATELINKRDAVVVDVRPASDYAKGHILNAISLPMSGFKDQIATLEKHKPKPILISCRSGAQSQAACSQLRKAGFEEVFNLKGGVLAWQSANLPLSRKKR